MILANGIFTTDDCDTNEDIYTYVDVLGNEARHVKDLRFPIHHWNHYQHNRYGELIAFKSARFQD
jgi:hypothetical protein